MRVGILSLILWVGCSAGGGGMPGGPVGGTPAGGAPTGGVTNPGVTDPEPAQSCSSFKPCGGDVVGKWKAVQQCPYVAKMSSTCKPTVKTDDLGDYVWTFDGDSLTQVSSGVYATQLSFEARTCITDGNCSAWDLNSAEQVVSCSGGFTCDCSSSSTVTNGTFQGNYATNGLLLEFEGGDGSYCVSGNTLAIQFTGDHPALMIFQRQ